MSTAHDFPIIRYTPSSQVRSPLRLVRSMWRSLGSSRELSWRLFVRDLSAQYRQSLLGVIWSFAPPIVTGVIFIFLRSSQVVSFGETDIPYPVFVLVGTMLWQLFTDGLNAPLKSVTMSKPLLTKINFPYEALVLSAFYLTLFNFLIRALLILAVLILFGVTFTWALLLAVPAALMLILFGMAVGLLVTPFGMLYTDVASSLPIATQLFFFVTPVVYPPPKSFPFSLLATLNPVSPLLIGTRDLITKGSMANLGPFLILCGLTLITLLFAWVIYRVSLPVIIERMSA